MCKKILVYGYGISGRGAVDLLLSMEHEVALYDDNKTIVFPEEVEDFRGLSFDEMIDRTSLVVISPSIPLESPLCKLAVEKNVQIISEIELAYRNFDGSVVTITGTNGKTTTAQMITSILSKGGVDARAVGNIGNSFCSEISKMDDSSVAVVEASSFQLAFTDLYTSKIAVCLNVDSDHLEYHKTFDNYVSAKKRVFNGQVYTDYAVLNYDDLIVREMADDVHSQVFYFSTVAKVKGVYMVGGNIYFNDGVTDELVCHVFDIKPLGEHNVKNALASIAVAKILHIPNGVIKSVLGAFTLSAHRIELIAEQDGKRIYNDSKSTNVSSTTYACMAMNGMTTLLMGGYDKGLSYTSFFCNLPLKVNTVVLYGQNKDKLLADSQCMRGLTVIMADNIGEAIDIALKVRSENVLFSPGTSSYDSFADYEERGEYFCARVRERLGAR